MKLLQFWSSNLEVGFAQVEEQFGTQGITVQKKNKLDHIVASLATEYTFEVHDIILYPPKSHPYDHFCEIRVIYTMPRPWTCLELVPHRSL